MQQAMRLNPRDPRMGFFHDKMADAELGLGHFDAAIDPHSDREAGVNLFRQEAEFAPEERCCRGPRLFRGLMVRSEANFSALAEMG
jgi:hypothetical protein